MLKDGNLMGLKSHLRLEAIKPDVLTTPAKLFLGGTLLNGIANGIFNAVIQLYLISLGLESASLGFIFMMNSLSSALLTIPAGILGDRYGKAKITLVGCISVVTSMVVFFSTSSVEFFAISFLLIGVSNAAGVVLTPLYSSFFEKEDLDKAFGLYGFINISALSVGSLSGYIPTILSSQLGVTLRTSYRWVMLFAASLFILQYVFYLISTRGDNNGNSAELIFNLRNRNHVAKFCVVSFLTQFAGGIFFSLFPYYVNSQFGIQSDALGGLFFVSNLVMALSKAGAPMISKRWGSLRSITISIGLSGLFFLLIPVAPSFAVLAGFYILRMGTRFLSDPLLSSMFMKGLEDDETSTANSLRMMSIYIGSIAAPWLGGVTMDKIGLSFPAYLGGALTLATAIVFYLILRSETPKKLSSSIIKVD
ncbi:MAG: MFS transporter [Candidatus Bathyarchaeia archaeon]